MRAGHFLVEFEIRFNDPHDARKEGNDFGRRNRDRRDPVANKHLHLRQQEFHPFFVIQDNIDQKAHNDNTVVLARLVQTLLVISLHRANRVERHQVVAIHVVYAHSQSQRPTEGLLEEAQEREDDDLHGGRAEVGSVDDGEDVVVLGHACGVGVKEPSDQQQGYE